MPESFKLSVAKLVNIPDIHCVPRLDLEAFRHNTFVSDALEVPLCSSNAFISYSIIYPLR
jgi:hypothetical protein